MMSVHTFIFYILIKNIVSGTKDLTQVFHKSSCFSSKEGIGAHFEAPFTIITCVGFQDFAKSV